MVNQSDDASPMIFTFLHVARVVEERLETGLGAVDLSAARFGVLDQLALAGGSLSLGELAARASCVRSNITQLVDRLEADGLVRRAADPGDRRAVRAELTPLGQARRDAGRERVEAARQAFDNAISRNDRAALARVLSALGG